jgi:hypothetical protein
VKKLLLSPLNHHLQQMADSLEDDFALSDVEPMVGEVVESSARKRSADGGGDEGEEETEEEKKARKKRKMRQQDKNRKAKVSCARRYLR